ncbi:MAG: 2-amino-4-hydroxy-6-hydroxymethyldihydropteridine diphosphokinase [Beutenbergiaceae bacterium]
MADRIALVGVGGVGHHGVQAEERRDGQPFRVDLTLMVDTETAGRSDELSQSVDYAAVAADVVAVIEGEPVNLIETLAARIAAAVLRNPAVASVDITVHKPEAPVGVPFTDVNVSISRDRAWFERWSQQPEEATPAVEPAVEEAVDPLPVVSAEPVDPLPVEAAEPVDPLPVEAAEPVDPPPAASESAAQLADLEPELGDPDPLLADGLGVAPAMAPGLPVPDPLSAPAIEAEADEQSSFPQAPSDSVAPDAPSAAFAAPVPDALSAPPGPSEPSALSEPQGVPALDPPNPGPSPDSVDLDAPAPAPVDVVLGLGGNIGDVRATLHSAIAAFAESGQVEVVGVAPLARTAAVLQPDAVAQPDYLNTVVLLRSASSPRALLALAQRIEHDHGRTREQRWGERTLDIDLICYGDLTVSEPDLTLPHPRASERAFLLVPWAHLDPEASLPGLGGGPVALLGETAPDREGVRWLALDWYDPSHYQVEPESEPELVSDDSPELSNSAAAQAVLAESAAVESAGQAPPEWGGPVPATAERGLPGVDEVIPDATVFPVPPPDVQRGQNLPQEASLPSSWGPPVAEVVAAAGPSEGDPASQHWEPVPQEPSAPQSTTFQAPQNATDQPEWAHRLDGASGTATEQGAAVPEAASPDPGSTSEGAQERSPWAPPPLPDVPGSDPAPSAHPSTDGAGAALPAGAEPDSENPSATAEPGADAAVPGTDEPERAWEQENSDHDRFKPRWAPIQRDE